MAGIIVVDRIESDASYASSINIASPLVVANTVSFSQPVTVSNTFVVPAGTVSAPAITPTGDTNTGIYFPAADNIGFATNGVIRGRWTTDGLCFNADTAAANALDDYEEGTFTPTLGRSTTQPSLTLTGQNGVYVKIGNLVYVAGYLQVTAVSSQGTGRNEIRGVPFVPASVGSGAPVLLVNYNTVLSSTDTRQSWYYVGQWVFSPNSRTNSEVVDNFSTGYLSFSGCFTV